VAASATVFAGRIVQPREVVSSYVPLSERILFWAISAAAFLATAISVIAIVGKLQTFSLTGNCL